MSSETITIDGIAAGGDGVGRLADGRAVFVPRTVPGDVVILDPERLERRRSYARGQVAELLQRGSDRVAAPCAHYEGDRCGGCQLQHLAYPAQLRVKGRIVGDALRRIGKLDLADPVVEAAPHPFRYRTKIVLSAGPRGLGLSGGERTGGVFPLDDCQLADGRLMAVWHWLRSGRALLPRDVRRLVLRLDREDRVHVVVETRGPAWRDATRLRDADPPHSLVCWWQPVGGAPRVVAGPEPGFSATAFEPINPAVDASVRAWATAALGEVAGRVVWDLYGGSGDAAAMLAARGAQVVSVDADEGAVAWARRRAMSSPVRFIAGRVEDVVARLPAAGAAVLNPPREGLHWDVTLHVTAVPVPRIVYVSRDPATLARDLARLAAVYRVVGVRAFDLLPQTAHAAVVAVLDAA